MKKLKIFLLFCLCIFILYYYNNFIVFDLFGFISNLSHSKLHFLFFSVIFYFGSHLFRSFRIFFLNDNLNVRFRNVFVSQLKYNFLNIILPFKIGEIYRIIGFSKYLGNLTNSFILFFIERSFDVIILFVFFTISILFSDLVIFSDLYLPYFILFIIVSLIISLIVIGEDILCLLQKKVILSQNVRLSYILITTSRILIAFRRFKKIVKPNFIKILTISFLIWFLEFSSFFIFYPIVSISPELYFLLLIGISFSGFWGFSGSFFLRIYVIFEIVLNRYNINNNSIELISNYISLLFGFGIIAGIIAFLLTFKKSYGK